MTYNVCSQRLNINFDVRFLHFLLKPETASVQFEFFTQGPWFFFCGWPWFFETAQKMPPKRWLHLIKLCAKPWEKMPNKHFVSFLFFFFSGCRAWRRIQRTLVFASSNSTWSSTTETKQLPRLHHQRKKNNSQLKRSTFLYHFYIIISYCHRQSQACLSMWNRGSSNF